MDNETFMKKGSSASCKQMERKKGYCYEREGRKDLAYYHKILVIRTWILIGTQG